MGLSVSDAWAVVIALYLLQALVVWCEGLDRTHRSALSPRQRRRARRTTVVTALAWPPFALADLVVRGSGAVNR